MNYISELSNTIKYDFKKCTQCVKCIHVCHTKALSLCDSKIELKYEFCVGCKKCISICDTNALYFNINDGIFEGNNVIALVPYNVDERFLSKKYGSVITYELGEKVSIIETAFEMEKLSSKKINNEFTNPLIISDVPNIDLILKYKYPKLLQYLTKIKNVFYISSYLARINNKDSKIVAYAVPFEIKNYFMNIKLIDEICDIPFKMSYKYNLLTILNTYINLCKLESDIDLTKLEFINNCEIVLKNKTLTIRVLLINDINILDSVELNLYDYIFVCKENTYISNYNILKDKDVNDLYKNKFKTPGKITAFYKKG